MQLGYSTWGMSSVPIDVILPHLADLGFDSVEICVLPRFTTALESLHRAERRRIATLLEQHNLTLSAVNAYLSMMEQDPEMFARNLAYVKGAIDLAVDWAQHGEPPPVITGIGGKPGELAAAQSQLIELLGAL